MKKSKRDPEVVGEANVLPVMNVMFLLIPALLLAMEVASMAAITVSPPHSSSAGAEPQPRQPQLELHVRVASDGFWLTASDAPIGVADRPSVARRGDEYDFASLELAARELKLAHPNEGTVYLTAEADVSLQVLVSTMDALRGADCELSKLGEDEVIPGECLFWRPVVQSL